MLRRIRIFSVKTKRHMVRRGRTTMDVRGRKSWTGCALAVALSIGALPAATGAQAGAGAQGRGAGAQAPAGGAQAPAGGAQGRGGGRGGDPNAGAPYTPAAGAKDLKATVFNWMW